MNKVTPGYRLPFAVFLFTTILLSFLQVRLENPILLAERFFKGGGWIEIFVIALYGAIVAYYMQIRSNVPKWRKLTWTIFSVVFFMQLLLGLSGVEKCLMTGKLHLPIPAMILAGPIYRGQLSVMTLLFISTILLSGPAWCSHLCYFGAFDNLAAGKRKSKSRLKNKTAIKTSLILLIILFTLVLRWFNIPNLTAVLFAILFGIAGIIIMVIYSRRKGKMVHCVLYCPIGTIVNYTKQVNPFRLYIDKSCTLCMKCTVYCKYDALNPEDIRSKKPGRGCTLCGDCLAGCRDNSIRYGFLRLSPETSRSLYLFITISLHACFLAMARI